MQSAYKYLKLLEDWCYVLRVIFFLPMVTNKAPASVHIHKYSTNMGWFGNLSRILFFLFHISFLFWVKETWWTYEYEFFRSLLPPHVFTESIHKVGASYSFISFKENCNDWFCVLFAEQSVLNINAKWKKLKLKVQYTVYTEGARVWTRKRWQLRWILWNWEMSTLNLTMRAAVEKVLKTATPGWGI